MTLASASRRSTWPSSQATARTSLISARLAQCLSLSVVVTALGIASVACGQQPLAPSSKAGYIAVVREPAASCVDTDAADGHLATGLDEVSATIGDSAIIVMTVGERDATADFPWNSPSSADTTVLRPETACPGRITYGLPESRTAFRAIAAGNATVNVSIRAGWSPPAGGYPLAPYSVTVKVS